MILKSCEKNEKNIAEVVVEVTAEEFGEAVTKAFNKNKGSIAVPGFRKGKAPRKIIEKMYGTSIFYNDALDTVLPSACTFGVEETKLRVVSFPSITDVDVKDDGAGVDVKFTVAVYPEITVGEYKGLSAPKPEVKVEDSAIDSELASVRLRNARIEPCTRPAINGDTTIIDFEGFVDGETFEGGKGENYELVLGSNSFIPGFEEKMQGMTVGEERDLDLVFPEKYAENLAGKPVTFKVKLKELKEKILPELDDEFAKDVSEFDTLGEYKNSIKEKLLKAKQEESDSAFETALVDKLIETMEGEIPEPMIEEHMETTLNNFKRQIASYGMDYEMYLQMMGASAESFSENMRQSAEKRIRAMLVLEKVAELEQIELSEDELEESYKEMAERYGVEVETVKDSMESESLGRELKMRKAAKILTENAIALPPEEEKTEDISNDEQPEKVNEEKAGEKPAKTTRKKTAAKKTVKKSEELTGKDETPDQADN